MTNDITELREHLFETLRGLRDKDSPLDLDRAKVISQVAGTLIDSARVEVDFIKATGGDGATGFIAGSQPALPAGIVGIRQHRLK